jgi:cell division protein FtsW
MPAAWRARLSAHRSSAGGRRRGAAAQPIEYSILVTATLCLLAAGAVMVYSASSAPSLLKGGNGAGYLIKYLMYGAVGLVAMRIFARQGLPLARRLTGPLLVTSFVLVVAVHIPHVGVSVNGARRWLGAGPLQFQPSELMKLALVLYSAELLARRPQRAQSLRALLNPLLVVFGAACLLVASQPDIGTAMVIAFTITALLVAAGMPGRQLALLAGVAAAAVLLYALANPYSRARLTSFVNPWAHAGTTGFQAVQGQIAIGSGGLFGRGPGQSVQKVFYLPEAPTDFILAVIGEELGVLGVCGLLLLYGMIAFAGLRAARGARTLHLALLAVGLTSLILSQAVLNVFAVLGLAPLTGVPLPFISYGSTSLIVMLSAMGLLLNVAGSGSAQLRAVTDTGAARRASRGGPRSSADGLSGASSGRADEPGRESARWQGAAADEDRDRRRRDRRARRAGAGGSQRAAG